MSKQEALKEYYKQDPYYGKTSTEEKTVYVRISKRDDLEIIEVLALDLNDALKKVIKMGYYPLASSYSRENLNEDSCPKTVWDL